jgi:chromosome condensin MukBEF ATPase and DNA-binding subunit MukB
VTERTEATIAAELREVERYLRSAPPHAGAGAREALLARRDRLQRELATTRSRREERGSDRT